MDEKKKTSNLIYNFIYTGVYDLSLCFFKHDLQLVQFRSSGKSFGVVSDPCGSITLYF